MDRRLTNTVQLAILVLWALFVAGVVQFSPSLELHAIVIVLAAPVAGLAIWSFEGAALRSLIWVIPLFLWNAVAYYWNPLGLGEAMLIAGVGLLFVMMFIDRRRLPRVLQH